MKKNKWIALLSVMLGATVIFSACSDEKGDATAPTAAPAVEATFSNFIKTEYKKPAYDMEYKGISLNNEYGAYKAHSGSFYLFMKAGVTPLAERSETWTIYDAETQKAVWMKVFTYTDGDYSGVDKYGLPKHAPVEVSVGFKTYSFNASKKIPYVEVIVDEYEALTEDEIQAQLDSVNAGRLDKVLLNYKQTTTSEYYSVDGQLICKAGKDVEVKSVTGGVQDRILFGRTCAKFDEDNKLVETWNVETTNKVNAEEESELYSYATGNASGEITLDVYSKKTDALVYRYCIGGMQALMEQSLEVVILQDGDVAIQKQVETTGADYDIVKSGKRYLLETKRIDVETGKIETVDFPYVIESTYTKEEFSERLSDECTLTDNVYNVARVSRIDNGKIAEGEQIYVFFDNMLNVQYEWKAMYHGHNFNTNIDVLKTGNLLISLQTPLNVSDAIVNQAIITPDGELVSYIPADAVILEEGILVDGKLMDFDGKLLYKMDSSNSSSSMSGYDVVAQYSFGNGYIWQGVHEDPDTHVKDYKIYRVYSYDYNDGYSSSVQYYSTTYSYQVIECTESYMLVYDHNNDYYCVYDGKMDTLAKFPSAVESSEARPQVYACEESDSIVITVGDHVYQYKAYVEVKPYDYEGGAK